MDSRFRGNDNVGFGKKYYFATATTLYRLGLILKNEKNKYYVPWDVIVTETPLTVIHKPNRA